MVRLMNRILKASKFKTRHINLLDFKFTAWSVFVLFSLGFPPITNAQLGKAYENVYFRAQSVCGRFELSYGDGYIGASEIRFKPTGGKKQVLFMPDFGAPESNGDFRFHDLRDKKGKMRMYSSSGPDGFRTDRSIVLRSISDEVSAPDQIKGICYLQNHSYTLLFKRVQR